MRGISQLFLCASGGPHLNNHNHLVVVCRYIITLNQWVVIRWQWILVVDLLRKLKELDNTAYLTRVISEVKRERTGRGVTLRRHIVTD